MKHRLLVGLATAVLAAIFMLTACSSNTVTTVSSTKTVLTPGPTNTVYTTTTVSNVITAQATPLPTTVGGPVSFVSAEVVPPYVPAGPTVKITLRNDSDQPVVALNLILWVVTPGTPTYQVRPVQFSFDVSGLHPLPKGLTAFATTTIVGPGSTQTLATVNATLQNGQNYSYLIYIP